MRRHSWRLGQSSRCHSRRFFGADGACRALLQLTQERRWGDQLVQLLQHQQLQVRRAALMDLGAAGWRDALEPIAATLAENSLKLIALRGLVEHHPAPAAVAAPDQETVEVLDAMDALL